MPNAPVFLALHHSSVLIFFLSFFLLFLAVTFFSCVPDWLTDWHSHFFFTSCSFVLFLFFLFFFSVTLSKHSKPFLSSVSASQFLGFTLLLGFFLLLFHLSYTLRFFQLSSLLPSILFPLSRPSSFLHRTFYLSSSLLSILLSSFHTFPCYLLCGFRSFVFPSLPVFTPLPSFYPCLIPFILFPSFFPSFYLVSLLSTLSSIQSFHSILSFLPFSLSSPPKRSLHWFLSFVVTLP